MLMILKFFSYCKLCIDWAFFNSSKCGIGGRRNVHLACDVFGLTYCLWIPSSFRRNWSGVGSGISAKPKFLCCKCFAVFISLSLALIDFSNFDRYLEMAWKINRPVNAIWHFAYSHWRLRWQNQLIILRVGFENVFIVTSDFHNRHFSIIFQWINTNS